MDDLTVETLLEYLNQARQFNSGYPHEKRKAPRISLAAMVRIMPMEGQGRGELFAATLANVSSRGAGLKTQAALTVDQRFCMKLSTAPGDSKWIQCVVVRVPTASSGESTIGVRFYNITCSNIGEQPIIMDEPTMTPVLSEREKVAPHQTTPSSIGTRAGTAGSSASAHIEVLAELIDSVRKDKTIRVVIRSATTKNLEFTCRGQLAVGTRMSFVFNLGGTRVKRVTASVTKCVPQNIQGFHVNAEMITAVMA